MSEIDLYMKEGFVSHDYIRVNVTVTRLGPAGRSQLRPESWDRVGQMVTEAEEKEATCRHLLDTLCLALHQAPSVCALISTAP